MPDVSCSRGHLLPQLHPLAGGRHHLIERRHLQVRQRPLHTLGNVCSEPSLYATALDRSPADRRGAAMATYTSAFQLGSGIGAALGGVIIERWGYEAMYRATLAPIVVGLAWIAVQGRRNR